jgi:hypothetical protein
MLPSAGWAEILGKTSSVKVELVTLVCVGGRTAVSEAEGLRR